MSANAVPGFKPIPRELLETPKPCLMTTRELARTLGQLLRMGLIEAVERDGDTAFRVTAKGKRVMGRSA